MVKKCWLGVRGGGLNHLGNVKYEGCCVATVTVTGYYHQPHNDNDSQSVLPMQGLLLMKAGDLARKEFEKKWKKTFLLATPPDLPQ